MSRPSLALLRRLHRSLAYSTVETLADMSVDVQSPETSLDDVLHVVRSAISINVTSMGPDVYYRSASIAKYGILDLTFGIGSTSLNVSRPGIGILRSLGLVDGAESAEGLDVTDQFLNDLVSESETGALHLKIFLDMEGALPPHDSLRRLREGVPPGFLPHRFVVRDACLTNASSIWLVKHFYL